MGATEARGFDSPIQTVEGILTSKGYLAAQGAGVEDFKNSGILGLLYVDSHGADLVLTPAGGSRPRSSLWTSTDVTAAQDRLYREDLRRGRLACYTADTNQPDGPITLS